MGSIFVFAMNTGSLIGFVVGNYFDFQDQAKILLLIPTLFFIVFTFVPETPEYLRRQHKNEVMKKAKKRKKRKMAQHM